MADSDIKFSKFDATTQGQFGPVVAGTQSLNELRKNASSVVREMAATGRMLQDAEQDATSSKAKAFWRAMYDINLQTQASVDRRSDLVWKIVEEQVKVNRYNTFM